MRATRKKPRPSELLMFYGKLPNDVPDMVMMWGEGCSKRDGHFLHYHLCCEKPNSRLEPDFRMEKSFIQQLEERGYDPKTLQFSIRKKDESTGPNPTL
jgi:hypothetical protein